MAVHGDIVSHVWSSMILKCNVQAAECVRDTPRDVTSPAVGDHHGTSQKKFNELVVALIIAATLEAHARRCAALLTPRKLNDSVSGVSSTAQHPEIPT